MVGLYWFWPFLWVNSQLFLWFQLQFWSGFYFTSALSKLTLTIWELGLLLRLSLSSSEVPTWSSGRSSWLFFYLWPHGLPSFLSSLMLDHQSGSHRMSWMRRTTNHRLVWFVLVNLLKLTKEHGTRYEERILPLKQHSPTVMLPSSHWGSLSCY